MVVLCVLEAIFQTAKNATEESICKDADKFCSAIGRSYTV